MEVVLIISIFVSLVFGIIIGNYLGRLIIEKRIDGMIDEHRRDAVIRSRAVLKGQFSEQLAPHFPNFPYNPGECKFLGKPVDFICFSGLDDKQEGRIDEIVFVEVKSGGSKLSRFEKQVKECVEDGRVRFEEYRLD